MGKGENLLPAPPSAAASRPPLPSAVSRQPSAVSRQPLPSIVAVAVAAGVDAPKADKLTKGQYQSPMKSGRPAAPSPSMNASLPRNRR